MRRQSFLTLAACCALTMGAATNPTITAIAGMIRKAIQAARIRRWRLGIELPPAPVFAGRELGFL